MEAYFSLSLISVDQARANMKAQLGSGNFDSVRAVTQQQWRDQLALLQVNTDTQNTQEQGSVCVEYLYMVVYLTLFLFVKII